MTALPSPVIDRNADAVRLEAVTPHNAAGFDAERVLAPESRGRLCTLDHKKFITRAGVYPGLRRPSGEWILERAPEQRPTRFRVRRKSTRRDLGRAHRVRSGGAADEARVLIHRFVGGSSADGGDRSETRA